MKGLQDLIQSVAERSGETKAATERVLRAALEVVPELAKEDRLTLRGFGTFKFKTRAARAGRNPQTGEAIQIPESTSLTFKASK